MIKAFLRDNIRPDLELMKWCSKNDIGEEAYITVPLRYMTPHKLMRYATEQFTTHRKTSYYAPGYYSMREMMSDYKDYLCMCELLEHDMKSSFVLFPNDLKAEHDRVNDMSRMMCRRRMIGELPKCLRDCSTVTDTPKWGLLLFLRIPQKRSHRRAINCTTVSDAM